MSLANTARLAALGLLVALPLAGCVTGPANPSAARAADLAELVSRAVACNAGAPRASTLERFLSAEKARGATPEQLAAARSTYLTVSEAEVVNQGVRPQACTRAEREALRGRMSKVRAGQFEGL
jgi:hypothetical protein